MTGQNHLVKLIDEILPLLKNEIYNYEVTKEICTLCLQYVHFKETALFSYVVMSIFNELNNYITDVVWNLGKSFGVTAQNREEERISKYLRDDFTNYLQYLKKPTEDLNMLHSVLTDMICKWLTFKREEIA
jgi:hypothetical protein